MGWQFPFQGALQHHGPLMAGSFLGTLIILERIVALSNRALLIIPLINVCSLPLFLLGFPLAAVLCLITGATGLVFIFIRHSFQHRFIWNYIMTAGALCYLAGNILIFFDPPPWCRYGMEVMKTPYYVGFPWWMGFFLLTITGERLELSQFLPVSKLAHYFLTIFLMVFIAATFFPVISSQNYLMAASLTLISLWLLKYDMAFHSIKKEGQFRYTGILLITGYLWLLISSAILLLPSSNPLLFDALLHSFFIGFVFSMIFAHAPIILPAVAGINAKPYHPVLYIWSVLLNVSLIVRITGDLLPDNGLRQWGGLLNGIVIIAFFINMLILVLLSRTKS